MTLPLPAYWFGESTNDGTSYTPHREPRVQHASSAEVDLVSLLEGIRRNDTHALETLYRQYFERLAKYARQLTQDADLAQSIVQDVFVAIWERRASWQVTGSLDGYLYRAVRNGALTAQRNTHLRARIGGQAATESGASPGMAQAPEDISVALEHRELSALITRAIAALPPRQHEALALRWSHRLSYAEAGRIMDVSEARVRQLVARAEEQVRARVRNYLLDE